MLKKWNSFFGIKFLMSNPFIFQLFFIAGVANLRFLNPGKKNVFALAGDSLDLDCKTSNTSANVLLWVRKRKSDLGNNVPESNRVKLSNQVFKMYNLSLNDGGLYSCKARDSNGENIEKDIGMLIVLQGKGPSLCYFCTV